MSLESKIVPRWEWRIFAPSLTTLRGKLGADGGAIRASRETYVLSAGVDRNAKIRDDTFDIKLLRQVKFQGLEQWEPVFKARFPLGAPEIERAWSLWDLSPPSLRYDRYSAEAFLRDLVPSSPSLRAVTIDKARCALEYAGCIAEFATVAGLGISLETISIEHEDPQRILAALAELNLDPRDNTNYPRALRRALSLPVC
jgi:exopolyphosphatase/guanosine-5'-triphosphate,3'-diphosphate pyrophosphatase